MHAFGHVGAVNVIGALILLPQVVCAHWELEATLRSQDAP